MVGRVVGALGTPSVGPGAERLVVGEDAHLLVGDLLGLA
jgi:hypothetical protein